MRSKDEIAQALARRDRLAQRVARLDRAITIASRQYCAAAGMSIPLRDEALRKAVGAAPPRSSARA